MAFLHGVRALVVGGGAAGRAAPGAVQPMGNGRAICTALASAGAEVIVADIDKAAAEATVSLIADDGGRAHTRHVDVADPQSCRSLVSDTIRSLGGVDAVVLNVGIHTNTRFRQQTVDDWDRVMAVNVRGHWVVAQAAIEDMLTREAGTFVFVCSAAAVKSSGVSVAYEASKAAQLAIMRHLAVRFGARGIRSNAVVLGTIDSGMVRELFGASDEASTARDAMSPMARQGRPDEVGAAVAFLVSTDASYINGAEIAVDGGLSAASPLFRPAPASRR